MMLEEGQAAKRTRTLRSVLRAIQEGSLAAMLLHTVSSETDKESGMLGEKLSSSVLTPQCP
jgi:hypothetical protein